MKIIYEGVIGSYSFQYKEGDIIEVWGFDNEQPESFIYVREGSIKNEKDFHTEISYFYITKLNG